MSLEKFTIFVLVIIVLLWMLLYRLAEVPPVWFDEGWTLARARTWVETGAYARLLQGEPISAKGMSWGLPVTVPIALSFKIFGVGLWQGRLPITLFTAGGLAAFWFLCRKIYSSSAAWWGFLILVLLPPHGRLNSLLMGKQALGEVPMMFYLLMGYLFAERFLRGEKYSSILAGIFWGLALDTKAQLLPFFVAAFAIPLAVAYFNRDRTTGIRFSILASSSLISWFAIQLLTGFLENGLPLYGAPMQGLYRVTAFVPLLSVRMQAILFVLLFGWYPVAGMVFEYYHQFGYWRQNMRSAVMPVTAYIRLSLFILMVSWFLWFLLLSIGWYRYYYPIYFLAAAPFGILISKLLKPQRKDEQKLSWIVHFSFGVLIVIYGIFFGFNSWQSASQVGNSAAEQTAAWIKANTEQESVIETYDSELVFLIEGRNVHYPPDQIQVELNRRYFLGEDVRIDYPLKQIEPDYIVVGPYSRLWKLYDEFLFVEGYQLVQQFGNYDVYENPGNQ